jgi:hypothetical protein
VAKFEDKMDGREEKEPREEGERERNTTKKTGTSVKKWKDREQKEDG